MLLLQGVSYTYTNGEPLFNNLHLTVANHEKVAIVGNNGSGKSTLLRIVAGEVMPTTGQIATVAKPYFVPQIYGQYNQYTIAQMLRVEGKLHALHEILTGNTEDIHFAALDEDWNIEERCREALLQWGLQAIDLTRTMGSLSGGQKTKVALAGIAIHKPQLVLLDEPSNHLDHDARQTLCGYVRSSASALIMVSHDRELLNLPDKVYELDKQGLTAYGGNYEFYKMQKAVEAEALQHDVHAVEKALRKAKAVERETMERQQKLNARGRKKQEAAGVPRIALNTLRNNAEKSTARLKGMHTEKITTITNDLNQLRQELPDTDTMRIAFSNSGLHSGKILVNARQINIGYSGKEIWRQPKDLCITSGERIAIKGNNGSGKTSLIKMIMGQLQPLHGQLDMADFSVLYIDQDYSLISNTLTVYEQLQQANSGNLLEHELKSRLNRFLFTKVDWHKPGSALSGGEKMRLLLCCLTISTNAPDMIILDEPTNNLDLQNVAILTAAINNFRGTLIVVSHDAVFLKEVSVEREIELGEMVECFKLI